MRLKKKYINAKLVCDIADSIASQIGDKSAKTFSRLLRKSVKAVPGIKVNQPVITAAEPVQVPSASQRPVLGSVYDFVSALRGDMRVVAELPSGEIVFDGYLDECLQDELEDYDITNICFRDGLARVSVQERTDRLVFVVAGSDEDDCSEEDC
jgi:hypothetical protein